MRIVILGTGGYHPNERRHTACVMIPERGIIFDAGTGFFRVPQFVEQKKLNVFLSHAHFDHIIGLTFPLVALHRKEIEAIRIFGDAKTLQAVQIHLFAEPTFPVVPDFEYVELAESTTVPGNGILTYCPLNHPGGSIGFRIDWPETSLAYITDTIADGTYTDFVAGVDLLIHECNFPDSGVDLAKMTGHSYTTSVARVAAEASVKRLVLTHIDPQLTSDDPIDLSVAQAIFRETTIAQDLDEIEL